MRSISLMRKLWQDDCGAVITAEYTMLFGVVALGAAQGLSTLRDATNQELKEAGAMVRETRLHYSPQLNKSSAQAQQPPQQQAPASAFYGVPAQSPVAQPCVGGLCP